jgi:hypothetical protein
VLISSDVTEAELLLLPLPLLRLMLMQVLWMSRPQALSLQSGRQWRHANGRET